MEKTLHTDRFRLGVCYYPEHWDEALWKDDFRRMKELGFSVIRIAEFAWSIFEPEEGVFSFEFFDRALAQAQEYGLDVILGTPTATPPAWLTHKYPEVLNVNFEGVRYNHGQRRHYNYNSPKYRELSARIVRQMAEHYKDHPAVIGWQIDNELNCEVNVFYSEADHAAFRVWLQDKYGTLEKLNDAWGAVFWSQTYTDWAQVHLTRPTPSDSPNPHQALDEKRFFSDSAISFAKFQTDIIREAAPGHFITTNGMFGHLDSHKLTDDLLDFFSYDSYPVFGITFPDSGENPLLDRGSSKHLSLTRSISPNFCVMEQQSGPGGWVNRMEQPSPKPGQMRLWTYQSVGHGADMLLYFRWRTATMGTEIYWHGINDYHNRPNRRVKEAGQIGAELASVGAQLVGSRYTAEVGIVHDYDNVWDGELDLWHGPLGKQSTQAWFKTLQHEHIPCDFVHLTPETELSHLSNYKVLVYPHAAILTDETADLLKRYAEQGGTVIFGARTGYKDIHGRCPMRPLPGAAAALCGITVEDFTWVQKNRETDVRLTAGENASGLKAPGFNDILHVEADGIEVLAEYASDYYAGKPVLTRNKLGRGSALYYGAAFTEPMVRELIGLLGLASPVAGWQLPPDVEVCVRRSADKSFVFLLNYGSEPAAIQFDREVTDILTGQSFSGDTTMKPYDVYVIEQ